MPAEQRKKMIPSMILDILREQTDENHTMDQKAILDALNKEFNPPLDRKTVRRNIEYLIEIGVPIVYTEKPRKGGNDVWTDFYLSRDFTEPELRLLIDGLLFSNHLPYKRCMQLVEKIESLSSTHFKAHVKHIKTGTCTQWADIVELVRIQRSSSESMTAPHAQSSNGARSLLRNGTEIQSAVRYG